MICNHKLHKLIVIAQNNLPENKTPLCFVLYADKTKLSSFGIEMGYPIMAKLAHLPADIRDSEGTGGACVVRWLPIVCELYHFQYMY